MQIDEFGFDATSVDFHRRKLRPYIVLVEGDVTYICFRNKPERCIHRITKDGDMTVFEWAWGRWEDRANLTYVPINETIKIADPESQ